MIRRFSLFAATAALIAAPASAQTSAPVPPTPRLSLEQHAALRCSAAFALGAGMQQAGKRAATGWPPLAERGKEFFVRVAAQLMDETGLTREAVGELVQAEVRELAAGDKLDKAMPACLLMLDGSGL